MPAKKLRVGTPELLKTDTLLKNVPFIVFLSFLALVYIANAHYSEKAVREIQVLQAEIKELRWQYVSLQAENMYESKRSEVEERVAPLGLSDKGRKPKRIIEK